MTAQLGELFVCTGRSLVLSTVYEIVNDAKGHTYSDTTSDLELPLGDEIDETCVSDHDNDNSNSY